MSESSTPGWSLAWRVLSALETGALAGLARRGPALPPPNSVVPPGSGWALAWRVLPSGAQARLSPAPTARPCHASMPAPTRSP
ncbi:unnamed protein product [Plutella xylostella]|uniref:(diamondback moth) hypothetical protein n=1 Tax=Plutella xylostella TaxID=51655 RepID=A0A8S4G8N4_PLUXY|nr:unnamed protein product [Plutella xylostella]